MNPQWIGDLDANLLLHLLQMHLFEDILQKSFKKVFLKCSLISGFQTCNFIKKKLQHRCFPEKFVKCLRRPFLENNSSGCCTYSIYRKNYFLELFLCMDIFIGAIRENQSFQAHFHGLPKHGLRLWWYTLFLRNRYTILGVNLVRWFWCTKIQLFSSSN